MNVYLIGTSNSIFKNGYSAGIAESKGVSFFAKGSIGASPSVIIPYFLSKTNISDYDWLVIDTSINDRNFYLHNAITIKQIKEFVEYGIIKAINNKCVPFLLIMPTLDRFGKKSISSNIYYELSHKHRIPLFDGYKYLESYSRDKNIDIKSCFKDPFHVLPEIAYHIGTTLVKVMRKTALTISKRRLTVEFRNIHLPNLTNSYITRKNSLTENEFIQLKSGDKVTIQICKNEEVCGCTYNAALTFGSICLEDDIKHIKELSTNFLEKNKKLLVLSTPFVNPIYSRSGRLQISLPSPECKASEKSRFMNYTPIDNIERLLEIESLVIRSNTQL